MTSGKRIIITGATGQIGKPLCRQLIDQGYEVVDFSRTPVQARSLVPGALALGYSFQFPQLEPALRDLTKT